MSNRLARLTHGLLDGVLYQLLMSGGFKVNRLASKTAVMPRPLSLLLAFLLLHATGLAQPLPAEPLTSPNGALQVRLWLDAQGVPTYTVIFPGSCLLSKTSTMRTSSWCTR